MPDLQAGWSFVVHMLGSEWGGKEDVRGYAPNAFEAIVAANVLHCVGLHPLDASTPPLEITSP